MGNDFVQWLSGELNDSLARLDRQAERVKASQKRIDLALASGVMDQERYRATDDTLLRELDAIATQRREIEKQIEAIPDPEAILAAVRSLSGVDLAKLDPLELNAALRAIGLRVYAEEGEVKAFGF